GTARQKRAAHRGTLGPSRSTTQLPPLRTQPPVAVGRTNGEPAVSSLTSTAAPDDASRSVIRLVLTLVEFVRQLLERHAVRRVRERTLTPAAADGGEPLCHPPRADAGRIRSPAARAPGRQARARAHADAGRDRAPRHRAHAAGVNRSRAR